MFPKFLIAITIFTNLIDFSHTQTQNLVFSISLTTKVVENSNSFSINNIETLVPEVPELNSTNSTSTKYTISLQMFIIISVLYGSISVISVLGNILIIFVVVKNKRMQNVTNYFISNLALADVVIGMFSTPFQAAYLQKWIFPDIMCKIVPFAATLSVNVSIITLVAISLDRYYVILYPFKQKLRVKQCIFILIIVWIVSILMSVIKLLNYNTAMGDGNLQCEPVNNTLFQYESVLLAILQYIVPFFIISFTYFRIGFHIYFDDSPNSVTDNQGKNKRKVIKMIFIVVSLFMICWAPIQLFNILNALLPDWIDKVKDLNIIWFFTNGLALSNSCYNVFIYGACSARYKREFRKILSCLPCVNEDLTELENSYLRRQYTYKHSLNSNAGTMAKRYSTIAPTYGYTNKKNSPDLVKQRLNDADTTKASIKLLKVAADSYSTKKVDLNETPVDAKPLLN